MWCLWLLRSSLWTWWLGAWQQEQLRAYISIHKYELGGERHWECLCLVETSKPAPNDRHPPTWPYLPILPKQFHQLGPSIQICEPLGHSHPSHHRYPIACETRNAFHLTAVCNKVPVFRHNLLVILTEHCVLDEKEIVAIFYSYEFISLIAITMGIFTNMMFITSLCLKFLLSTFTSWCLVTDSLFCSMPFSMQTTLEIIH